MKIDESNIDKYQVVAYNSVIYGISPNKTNFFERQKNYGICQIIVLILFYLLILLFVAGIHCKLDKVLFNSIPWSGLLIPFSLSIIPLCIYYYLYIRNQIGYTTATFFCMKTTIFTILLFCFIVQVYLIILRVDGTIKLSYLIVFIPSCFCLLIFFALFILLIPMSISCHTPFAYYDIMLAIYCLATCASLCFLIRLLNFKKSNIPIRYIFEPIWIACGIHLLVATRRFLEEIWMIIFLLFSIMFSIGEYVKISDIMNIPWWGNTILFAVPFAFSFFV